MPMPLPDLLRRWVALDSDGNLCLPVGVREALGPPPGDAIAAELIAAGRTALAAQLGDLRNTLSHGSRNHQDQELLPWVKVVETMCRAHALRLLGFDAASITEASYRYGR